MDDHDFIPVVAYMYLPSPTADSTTLGYRWEVGE
jgi:hypothetical protein